MSSYISPHPLVCGAWEPQRRARACQSGGVSLDLLPSWRHVPRGRGGGAVVRASCSRREVLWKPVKRQGQGKLLPLCHIQIQRCLAERHGGAGEYLVRRRSGQRGRSVPELHPHTHRWRRQTHCSISTMLRFPGQLFCFVCLLSPLAQNAPEGMKLRFSSGVGVLYVCTGCLHLVVDDIFPPALALSLSSSRP